MLCKWIFDIFTSRIHNPHHEVGPEFGRRKDNLYYNAALSGGAPLISLERSRVIYSFQVFSTRGELRGERKKKNKPQTPNQPRVSNRISCGELLWIMISKGLHALGQQNPPVLEEQFPFRDRICWQGSCTGWELWRFHVNSTLYCQSLFYSGY